VGQVHAGPHPPHILQTTPSSVVYTRPFEFLYDQQLWMCRLLRLFLIKNVYWITVFVFYSLTRQIFFLMHLLVLSRHFYRLIRNSTMSCRSRFFTSRKFGMWERVLSKRGSSR